MKVVVLIIFLCGFSLTKSENEEDILVNYYTDLINNLTEEATSYKLPDDARMHEAQNKTVQDYGEFDFIIIGAGTAGCVVANRLSEIGEWKILLLEAGNYPDENFTDIPSLSGLNALSKFNWGFKSTSQEHAFLGNVGKKGFIRRGKGIGGTTLVNAMVYSRGHKLDYQKWADLLEDSSWNYENLLKYFKRSDNFTRTNHYAPIDTDYHGYDGTLHSTQTEPSQNISFDILNGAKDMGYEIGDYNGKQLIGGTIYQYNIKQGRRIDARQGFIFPARFRNNLKVLDGSYVTKLEISGDLKRVKGVIFTRQNKTYIARNKKEVILCAGVFQSPQILMLSGIGPKDHLENLGIPVAKDLPVGKYLRDHSTSTIVFSSDYNRNRQSMSESIRDFVRGRGKLTRPHLFDSALFLKSAVEETQNYPNMEISFKNISGGSYILQQNNGWSDEVYNALDAKVTNPFSINLSILHTKSKGTVKLKSKNPFEYPLIDPHLLSDHEGHDIESHYQGIQLSLELLKTEPLSYLNASLAIHEFPGCNHTKPLSKEYWYCYLRRVVVVGNHQISTCLVGANPETGVVDKQLKVFGIGGLRVADASVIPFPITGHTNAITTVIGEKVSDMIKETYRN